MMKKVFDCRMCGHCCEGEGGIVLGPRDLDRLCADLHLEMHEFLDRYAIMRNGKWHVRTGMSGSCLFFRTGEGCSVHASKPDVCRAWPYFHGNMVDAISLEMAKDFCPGISQDAQHAAFVAEGTAYLARYQLIASDPRKEGTALLPAEHVVSSPGTLPPEGTKTA